MAQFAKGDVVVLKSGGPAMTIESVGPNELKCVWFDSKNKRFSAPFDPELVEAYEPPPAGFMA